jgi:hypothetical protein
MANKAWKKNITFDSEFWKEKKLEVYILSVKDQPQGCFVDQGNKIVITPQYANTQYKKNCYE